jgi:hypothetical protein
VVRAEPSTTIPTASTEIRTRFDGEMIAEGLTEIDRVASAIELVGACVGQGTRSR